MNTKKQQNPMIFKKKVLCIIPVKKKSTGLKNKNFKKINSWPLYAHSINAALKCKHIDKIIVSSDSNRVLNYSKNPKILNLKRSKKLSSNKSQIKDVITDILKKVKSKFDILVLLQPTTPIISQGELSKSLNLICKKNYSSIVAIKSGNITIPNLLDKKRDGIITRIKEEKAFSSNRQDFKSYFIPSGDFFITQINYFKKNKSFYGRNALGFVTKNKFSVDINYKQDLEYLNFLINQNHKN